MRSVSRSISLLSLASAVVWLASTGAAHGAVSVAIAPAEFEPGESVTATASASTELPGRVLRLGWAAANGVCDPATVSVVREAPLLPNAPAVIEATTVAAPAATAYHACAWIQAPGSPTVDESGRASTTRLSAAALADRYRPIGAAPTGPYEDYLEAAWSSRTALSQEEILVWDLDPASGAAPIVDTPVDDSDEFEFTDLTATTRHVMLRAHIGYGTFWWAIRTTTSAGGTTESSPIRVEVVPPPLDRDSVEVSAKTTLRSSSRRPGVVRLRVQASPLARVVITVRHGGRVYARRAYTASRAALRGFDFRLSCRKTGTFTYEVWMRDPYGTRVTRRGRWTSSSTRCASLRAAEARKRAARRKPSSDGGGGGGGSTPSSGCHPSYRGACLKQNAGDYDCAGGSGNGPNYVSGPVQVVGYDEFDLDRDGNGVGCEG